MIDIHLKNQGTRFHFPLHQPLRAHRGRKEPRRKPTSLSSEHGCNKTRSEYILDSRTSGGKVEQMQNWFNWALSITCCKRRVLSRNRRRAGGKMPSHRAYRRQHQLKLFSLLPCSDFLACVTRCNEPNSYVHSTREEKFIYTLHVQSLINTDWILNI